MNNNWEEYIGTRIGHLEIIGYERGRHNHFICQCDCGDKLIIAPQELLKRKKDYCAHKECVCGTNIYSFIGKKYNKLTIQKIYFESNHKKCECKCDCGKIITADFWKVTHGTPKSCGCGRRQPVRDPETRAQKRHQFFMNKLSSRVGQQFGKLTIIDLINTNNNGHNRIKYLCRCECGNTTLVNYIDLQQGKTTSCGCAFREYLNHMKPHPIYHKEGWYFLLNGERVSCRSGYEVMFANYLMNNKIDFVYEPTTFYIPNLGSYTPDFYIKEEDAYYELKGHIFSQKQILKIQELQKTQNLKILFWEELQEYCGLKHSYSAYIKRGKKTGSVADYFALQKYY